MSRIKVIVKGQAGSGHHRAAEAILNALDRAGARITVESLDKLHAGNGAVYNGMSHKVKLKVVQEPRVKPSVPEPQEDLVNCALTLGEVLFIKARRGEKLTGFNVHQDNKGRYYFWCWGQQPDEPLLDRIADADPTVAAHRFLAIYEPGTGPNWGSFKQPTHKKPSPTLAPEANL